MAAQEGFLFVWRGDGWLFSKKNSALCGANWFGPARLGLTPTLLQRNTSEVGGI